MRDGSSFVLDNVRYVSELRRNLILLGILDKEGFTVNMQSGKIKVIKGSLVVLSGTRRANCVYTLDGQTVTRKTRSTQQCTKSRVVKHLGVAVILQQNGLVKEMNVTLLDKVRCFLIQSGLSKVLWVEDTTMSTYLVNKMTLLQRCCTELSLRWNRMRIIHLSYREDSNEAAFVVAAMDKIYAHESLTFNNTIACEVISKWKAGLKDDMDARSDVYVLSNGCKKCSDDSDGYYWEYTPWDCDVEKNGKWSCIYAVGSQEYQVVCTRLDIASVDVDQSQAAYMTLTEAANEAIWLKGLAIESGFELKIVAGIATDACGVKAFPKSGMQVNLLRHASELAYKASRL
ncbi:hypothetical protein Tco_1073903, partial [Tanacetum coccineum]